MSHKNHQFEHQEHDLFEGLAQLANSKHTIERVSETKVIEDFEALAESTLEIDFECWGTRLA